VLTLAPVGVASACSHSGDARVPITVAPTSSTTAPARQPEGFDLAGYLARYSHAPDDDRTTLANNGFKDGRATPAPNGVNVIALEFQGRDGAADTHAVWSAAGRQRAEGRTFAVPGIRSGVGVTWFDAARAATVEQVLFVKGTTLFVVEATVPAHSTDTDVVITVAREANAATG
jgi:hypothetical protein